MTGLYDKLPVVHSREGEDIADVLEKPGSILHEYRDNVLVVEDPHRSNISSTLLRKEVEQVSSTEHIS